MKTRLIAIICTLFFGFSVSAAQQKHETSKSEFGQAEHLLDGYSMNFQYQNGSAIHLEFYDGLVSYEWLNGPKKGHGNKDIPYLSKKIGHNQYLVNWHEIGLKDYLTFVFNFDTMVVHATVLVGYENKPERTLKTSFKTGVIDHLKHKDNF